MDKIGQIAIITVMLAIFAFVTAVVLAEPLKTLTDEVRDADHLNCDSAGLSMGVSATCVIVDLHLPFFIGTIIFGGLGIIKFGRAITVRRS